MTGESDGNVHEAWPGPVLVVAGPGTGKTHCLARRVKWLVQDRATPPDEISVVTFTAEAAQNMRDRLCDAEKPDVFLPADEQPKHVMTLHALGLRVIGLDPARCGLQEGFQLVTGPACALLLADAARLAGEDQPNAGLAARCRDWGCSGESGKPKCRVCATYVRILRACNAIDYADQIMLACAALKADDELLASYQGAATHLLVDEYQDINRGQYDLIRLLSGEHPDGLFVVGDDDQSIYGFRGGSPEFIRSFAQHFGPDSQVRHLTCCRRSPERFVTGALSVVQHFSPGRIGKPDLTFLKPQASRICPHDCPTHATEAHLVARIAEEALPSKSVLVLVPNRYFLPSVSRALRFRRIACDTATESPGEVLPRVDTFARWVATPDDNVLLRLCIDMLVNGPELGVPSSQSRLPGKLEQREGALREVAGLWGAVLDQAVTLRQSLSQTAEAGSSLTVSLLEALDAVVAASSQAPGDLVAALCRYAPLWRTSQDMLDEVSQWVEHAGGHRRGTTRGTVRVLTMHKAKGLEADVVVVLGLDEDVFPLPSEDIAEQSRLFYVSLTRAREELHLCHSRTRPASVTHLKQSYKLAWSPFATAIPSEHLEKVDWVPPASKTRRGRAQAEG